MPPRWARAWRWSAWSATTSRVAASRRWRARSASIARWCTTPQLPTTIKLRVIGRQQQLLRIDFEQAPGRRGAGAQARRGARSGCAGRRCWCCPTTARAACAQIELRSCDGAGGRHELVIVDPKGDDYARYRGRHRADPEPRRAARGRRRPGATRPTWSRARRQLRRSLDDPLPAADPIRGGHDPVLRRWRASRARAGARGL